MHAELRCFDLTLHVVTRRNAVMAVVTRLKRIAIKRVSMRFIKPIAFICVSTAIAYFAWLFFGPSVIRCIPSPKDAYASDWTSVFVIDHIRTSGAWPSGWEDLRDEFDRLEDASHYAWTFDELKNRVSFDWNANIKDVREADPPLKVFRLTSGRILSYTGDPNVLIRDYLRTGKDPWRVDPPMDRGR